MEMINSQYDIKLTQALTATRSVYTNLRVETELQIQVWFEQQHSDKIIESTLFSCNNKLVCRNTFHLLMATKVYIYHILQTEC